MATILSILKSLFPFIKEAFSVDDELRGSDRRLRIIFLSLIVVSLLLGWLGFVFLDHTKIINSSEIDRLEGRIELLEQSNQDARNRLFEERSVTARMRYEIERANNEIARLRRENRRLDDKLGETGKLMSRLEDELNDCPNPNAESVYNRLLELHGES